MSDAAVGTLLPASVLLPYQQRWVADPSPVKVCEKSRRVGLTWAEAADDALAASEIKGEDTWYIGYNKDMALEFIETVAMWAKAFSLAAEQIEDAGDVLEEADKEKGILAYRVRFASGHKVVALSSRPSNLRGKQGRVVLDEYAFHGEKAELKKAAMALIIWGGKVRIISTHDGDENEFNELVNDIRAGRIKYSLHRITFDEAIAEGLYRRVCQKLNLEWTVAGEREWRQGIIDFYGAGAEEELHVIPRSGGGVFIPGAVLQAHMSEEIPVVRWAQKAEFAEKPKHERELAAQSFCEDELLPLIDCAHPAYESCLGEDFGRSGDLTVMWPGQIHPNLVRVTLFVLELRNIPFEQQRQIAFFILDRLPRFRSAAFDARGNGQYLAEVAMQRYGSGRISQVMITPEWYRDTMPKYKAGIEDAMFVLPKHADILNDHRAIKMVKGIARVPENARSLGTDGGQRHADSAIAGAMFWYATQMDAMQYAYDGVPRSSHASGALRGEGYDPAADVASSGRFTEGAY